MKQEDKSTKISEKSTKTTNISSPVNTAPKKKSKLGLVIVIIVAVFIVLSIAGGWVFMKVLNTANAPEKVSNSLISDVQTNKASEGYALLSTKTIKDVSSEQFANYVSKAGPVLSGKPKVTNKQMQTNNGSNTAAITYEIKGSDGQTYTVVANLIKEGSTWKVVSLNIKKK